MSRLTRRGAVATLHGAAAVLWTPLNLGSKLVAWWDPGQGVTLNAGNVSAWADRVGGVSAAQATVAKQPAFSATARNGKPGVTINPNQTYLQFTPSSSFASGSAAGWLAASFFNNNASSVDSQAINYGANTSLSYRGLGLRYPNPRLFCMGTGVSSAATSLNTDDFAVMQVSLAGAQQVGSINFNGAATESANISTLTTSLGGGTLGTMVDTTANGWSGVLQHIYHGVNTLTTSERQKLEGYDSWITGKAGANLISGHPYKARAPYVSDP